MEAYIYDHVRTPRGRGRHDGALHEVTPIRLATQALEAVRVSESVSSYQTNCYGECQAIKASGVESTSRAPIGSDGNAYYAAPQINWRTRHLPQGIATIDGYRRIGLDEFAARAIVLPA